MNVCKTPRFLWSPPGSAISDLWLPLWPRPGVLADFKDPAAVRVVWVFPAWELVSRVTT